MEAYRYSPDISTHDDQVKNALSLVTQAFDKTAQELSGVSNRYDHLKTVVDPSRLVVLDHSNFVELCINVLKYDKWFAEDQYGVYVRRERPGLIDRDIVVIRADKIIPGFLLHEYIHRAFDIKSFQGIKKSETNRQIFGQRPKKEKKDDKPKRKGVDYLTIGSAFTEGLTHWSTSDMAQDIFPLSQSEKSVYTAEVMVVNNFVTQNLISRGLSLDESRLVMLDLAVTGDLTPLYTVLKAAPYTFGMRLRNVSSLLEIIFDVVKRQYEVESTKIQTLQAESGSPFIY